MCIRDRRRSSQILRQLCNSAPGLSGHYQELTGSLGVMAQAAFDGKVLLQGDGGLSVATMAGGCFWGPQLMFDRLEGVEFSAVGYTQGRQDAPTYEQICSGNTGHTEAVQVWFDESVIGYSDLLSAFWNQIDPLQVNGQGNDWGTQYRAGVYPHTLTHMGMAQDSFATEQNKWRQPIGTELVAAKVFWPAEQEHQRYLERGGRFGGAQSAAKGCTDPIRCYG
eukprot:TRINITY_DN52488_c0_g1_i1.p1 TRINITY_DN52488_c0_g1~~TRINITY_DN52488_c0_g1_i1.p1  ORF type:complete len:222 (+),score=63.54 TRINITY_DN52488_c0_g1_i1:189-854(+)